MKKKKETVIPAAMPEEVVTPRKASVRPLATGIGPVPVAPSAERVQLTPVIQPVAFIPYSTQEQPLYTFEPGVHEIPPMEVAKNQPMQDVNYESAPASAPAKSKINVAAIIVALLGILVAAIIFVPLVTKALDGILALSIINDENLTGGVYVNRMIDLLKVIGTDEFDVGRMLECGAAVGTGISGVLTALVCLFRLKKKGFGFNGRSMAAHIFAYGALYCVIAFTNEVIAPAGYALVGIGLLATIITFLVKSPKKQKKSK